MLHAPDPLWKVAYHVKKVGIHSFKCEDNNNNELLVLECNKWLELWKEVLRQHGDSKIFNITIEEKCKVYQIKGDVNEYHLFDIVSHLPDQLLFGYTFKIDDYQVTFRDYKQELSERLKPTPAEKQQYEAQLQKIKEEEQKKELFANCNLTKKQQEAWDDFVQSSEDEGDSDDAGRCQKQELLESMKRTVKEWGNTYFTDLNKIKNNITFLEMEETYKRLKKLKLVIDKIRAVDKSLENKKYKSVGASKGSLTEELKRVKAVKVYNNNLLQYFEEPELKGYGVTIKEEDQKKQNNKIEVVKKIRSVQKTYKIKKGTDLRSLKKTCKRIIAEKQARDKAEAAEKEKVEEEKQEAIAAYNKLVDLDLVEGEERLVEKTKKKTKTIKENTDELQGKIDVINKIRSFKDNENFRAVLRKNKKMPIKSLQSKLKELQEAKKKEDAKQTKITEESNLKTRIITDYKPYIEEQLIQNKINLIKDKTIDSRIKKLKGLESELKEIQKKVEEYRALSKDTKYKADSLTNNAGVVDTKIRKIKNREKRKQTKTSANYEKTVKKQAGKNHLSQAFDLGVPYDEDDEPQVYYSAVSKDLSFAVEFGAEYRVVYVPKKDKIFNRFVVRTTKITDKDLANKWRETPIGDNLYMQLVPPEDGNTWYFRLNLLQDDVQYYAEDRSTSEEVSEYNYYKPRPHQVATLRSSNKDIMISHGPGKGKTYNAILFAEMLRNQCIANGDESTPRILVVAPKASIVYQWQKEVIKFGFDPRHYIFQTNALFRKTFTTGRYPKWSDVACSTRNYITNLLWEKSKKDKTLQNGTQVQVDTYDWLGESDVAEEYLNTQIDAGDYFLPRLTERNDDTKPKRMSRKDVLKKLSGKTKYLQDSVTNKYVNINEFIGTSRQDSAGVNIIKWKQKPNLPKKPSKDLDYYKKEDDKYNMNVFGKPRNWDLMDKDEQATLEYLIINTKFWRLYQEDIFIYFEEASESSGRGVAYDDSRSYYGGYKRAYYFFTNLKIRPSVFDKLKVKSKELEEQELAQLAAEVDDEDDQGIDLQDEEEYDGEVPFYRREFIDPEVTNTDAYDPQHFYAFLKTKKSTMGLSGNKVLKVSPSDPIRDFKRKINAIDVEKDRRGQRQKIDVVDKFINKSHDPNQAQHRYQPEPGTIFILDEAHEAEAITDTTSKVSTRIVLNYSNSALHRIMVTATPMQSANPKRQLWNFGSLFKKFDYDTLRNTWSDVKGNEGRDEFAIVKRLKEYVSREFEMQPLQKRKFFKSIYNDKWIKENMDAFVSLYNWGKTDNIFDEMTNKGIGMDADERVDAIKQTGKLLMKTTTKTNIDNPFPTKLGMFTRWEQGRWEVEMDITRKNICRYANDDANMMVDFTSVPNNINRITVFFNERQSETLRKMYQKRDGVFYPLIINRTSTVADRPENIPDTIWNKSCLANDLRVIHLLQLFAFRIRGFVVVPLLADTVEQADEILSHHMIADFVKNKRYINTNSVVTKSMNLATKPFQAIRTYLPFLNTDKVLSEYKKDSKDDDDEEKEVENGEEKDVEVGWLEVHPRERENTPYVDGLMSSKFKEAITLMINNDREHMNGLVYHRNNEIHVAFSRALDAHGAKLMDPTSSVDDWDYFVENAKKKILAKWQRYANQDIYVKDEDEDSFVKWKPQWEIERLRNWGSATERWKSNEARRFKALHDAIRRLGNELNEALNQPITPEDKLIKYISIYQRVSPPKSDQLLEVVELKESVAMSDSGLFTTKDGRTFNEGLNAKDSWNYAVSGKATGLIVKAATLDDYIYYMQNVKFKSKLELGRSDKEPDKSSSGPTNLENALKYIRDTYDTVANNKTQEQYEEEDKLYRMVKLANTIRWTKKSPSERRMFVNSVVELVNYIQSVQIKEPSEPYRHKVRSLDNIFTDEYVKYFAKVFLYNRVILGYLAFEEKYREHVVKITNEQNEIEEKVVKTIKVVREIQQKQLEVKRIDAIENVVKSMDEQQFLTRQVEEGEEKEEKTASGRKIKKLFQAESAFIDRMKDFTILYEGPDNFNRDNYMDNDSLDSFMTFKKDTKANWLRSGQRDESTEMRVNNTQAERRAKLSTMSTQIKSYFNTRLNDRLQKVIEGDDISSNLRMIQSDSSFQGKIVKSIFIKEYAPCTRIGWNKHMLKKNDGCEYKSNDNYATTTLELIEPYGKYKHKLNNDKISTVTATESFQPSVNKLLRRMDAFPQDTSLTYMFYNGTDTPTDLDRQLVVQAFEAGLIDYILISDAGITGVDFKSTRRSQCILLSPQRSPGKLDQFVGRLVRDNSHDLVPNAFRRVDYVTFYSHWTAPEKGTIVPYVNYKDETAATVTAVNLEEEYSNVGPSKVWDNGDWKFETRKKKDQAIELLEEQNKLLETRITRRNAADITQKQKKITDAIKELRKQYPKKYKEAKDEMDYVPTDSEDDEDVDNSDVEDLDEQIRKQVEEDKQIQKAEDEVANQHNKDLEKDAEGDEEYANRKEVVETTSTTTTAFKGALNKLVDTHIDNYANISFVVRYGNHAFSTVHQFLEHDLVEGKIKKEGKNKIVEEQPMQYVCYVCGVENPKNTLCKNCGTPFEPRYFKMAKEIAIQKQCGTTEFARPTAPIYPRERKNRKKKGTVKKPAFDTWTKDENILWNINNGFDTRLRERNRMSLLLSTVSIEHLSKQRKSQLMKYPFGDNNAFYRRVEFEDGEIYGADKKDTPWEKLVFVREGKKAVDSDCPENNIQDEYSDQVVDENEVTYGFIEIEEEYD